MIKSPIIISQIKAIKLNIKWIGIMVAILLIGLGATYWLTKPDTKVIAAHQQIEILVQKIRDFYRNKPDAWGLNTASAIQNHLVDSTMIKGRMVQNALGKEVLLGADILGNMVMPGNRNAVIVYKNLTQKECRLIISQQFDEKMQLSLNSISIVNDQEHTFSWGGENSLPISREKANEICKKANDILWDIYL